VLCEAGAAGLPLVSTAVGGIPEIVEDGQTGLLVPPDDAGALAAALTKLVEQAAWLTGNNISAFVRTAVIEKIQRMSVDYPQLKDRRGPRAA